MTTITKTTVIEGNNQMNTKQQTTITDNKTTITASKLIRWAGLPAMGAGILYIAIQAIHPLDVFESVTTAQWATVHYLSIIMDLFSLLAMVGIYAKQVEKSGLLGLAGFLLFSLFWAISLAFHFIEAFISPVIASMAPTFVEGLLGMVNGVPSAISLGVLPIVYMLTGLVAYLFGGLFFGIATYRAGVMPRWAGGLLAFGTILPFLGSALVPHPFNRIFAVPVGLAMIWLGYALWSGYQAKVTESVTRKANPKFAQSTVG